MGFLFWPSNPLFLKDVCRLSLGRDGGSRVAIPKNTSHGGSSDNRCLGGGSAEIAAALRHGRRATVPGRGAEGHGPKKRLGGDFGVLF
jgi:hypothetical protein